MDYIQSPMYVTCNGERIALNPNYGDPQRCKIRICGGDGMVECGGAVIFDWKCSGDPLPNGCPPDTCYMGWIEGNPGMTCTYSYVCDNYQNFNRDTEPVQKQ